MDDEEKLNGLMDNERNLALYSLLGVVLAYFGLNLPFKAIWIFPVILVAMTAVIVVAYGVFRYLERREMLLDEEIELNEEKW